jgi:hypothetical protein
MESMAAFASMADARHEEEADAEENGSSEMGAYTSTGADGGDEGVGGTTGGIDI